MRSPKKKITRLCDHTSWNLKEEIAAQFVYINKGVTFVILSAALHFYSMKILVTGARVCGYHGINYLIDRRYEIVATGTNREKSKKGKWFEQVHLSNMIFRPGTEDLFQKFGRPDYINSFSMGGTPNYKNTFHIEKFSPGQYAFLENIIRECLKDIAVQDLF